jgi:hypothetical protein
MKNKKDSVTQEVYELVNIGYDSMYFACGLFQTLEEASEYIQSCLDDGSRIAWDIDDYEIETIRLIKYSFGLGDNLRREIREIVREYVYENEDSDDGTWKVTQESIKGEYHDK